MFPGLINAELGLLGLAGVCAVWLDVTFSKINNCTGTVFFFFSLSLFFFFSDSSETVESGEPTAAHVNRTIYKSPPSCFHVNTRLCSAVSPIMQCSRTKKKKVLLSHTLISLALLLQPISPFAPVLPNTLLGILGGEKSHFVLSDWLVSTNPLQSRLAWDHDGGRHCALAARPRWPSKWTINK